MKAYREYDLANERIKVGTDSIDPNGKYVVLAKHRGQEPAKDTIAKPFFSYTMPRSAPYDPTRYSEGIKLKEEFSLSITEECQDLPFEVVFDKRSKVTNFFDLEELPAEQITAE